MNGIKTTMLLAALTALFMALGYTLGGSGGAVIALLVAAPDEELSSVTVVPLFKKSLPDAGPPPKPDGDACSR